VLTCELSRVDFPATWYKDGQKVEESESLIVKTEGRKHRLILPEAQVRDSGEFECRTEGVSAFFGVTVQGQEPCWLLLTEADLGSFVNPALVVCWLGGGPFLWSAFCFFLWFLAGAYSLVGLGKHPTTEIHPWSYICILNLSCTHIV
jgi:hypothetical protein